MSPGNFEVTFVLGFVCVEYTITAQLIFGTALYQLLPAFINCFFVESVLYVICSCLVFRSLFLRYGPQAKLFEEF